MTKIARINEEFKSNLARKGILVTTPVVDGKHSIKIAFSYQDVKREQKRDPGISDSKETGLCDTPEKLCALILALHDCSEAHSTLHSGMFNSMSDSVTFAKLRLMPYLNECVKTAQAYIGRKTGGETKRTSPKSRGSVAHLPPVVQMKQLNSSYSALIESAILLKKTLNDILASQSVTERGKWNNDPSFFHAMALCFSTELKNAPVLNLDRTHSLMEENAQLQSVLEAKSREAKEIKGLQQTVATQAQQILRLQTETRHQAATITELEEEYKTLTTRRDELADEIATKNRELVEKTKSHEDLQKLKPKFQTILAIGNAQLKRVEELQTNSASDAEAIKQLQLTNTSLKKDNERLRDQIHALIKTAIAAFKDIYDFLTINGTKTKITKTDANDAAEIARITQDSLLAIHNQKLGTIKEDRDEFKSPGVLSFLASTTHKSLRKGAEAVQQFVAASMPPSASSSAPSLQMRRRGSDSE